MVQGMSFCSLELECELGIVRPDDGFWVGDLTSVDVAAGGTFCAQPFDHFVYCIFGALYSALDGPCLGVFHETCDHQLWRFFLCELCEVTSLDFAKDLKISWCGLHVYYPRLGLGILSLVVVTVGFRWRGQAISGRSSLRSCRPYRAHKHSTSRRHNNLKWGEAESHKPPRG